MDSENPLVGRGTSSSMRPGRRGLCELSQIDSSVGDRDSRLIPSPATRRTRMRRSRGSAPRKWTGGAYSNRQRILTTSRGHLQNSGLSCKIYISFNQFWEAGRSPNFTRKRKNHETSTGTLRDLGMTGMWRTLSYAIGEDQDASVKLMHHPSPENLST